MQAGYSPFVAKNLSDLVEEDLNVLMTVHEGWYVEYKSALPSPKDIAKSISAFANTYGGWLFLGIQEKSKEESVAGDFVGIEYSSLDAAIQTIRNSAQSHLSSAPHFEVKTISLDSSTEESKPAVICIWVPLSVSAPHIHSDGRIYRRLSDSSAPKPENDRHQLDVLWSRTERINQSYREWIEEDPELSDSTPYIRILLDADHFGARGMKWDFDFETFVSTLKDNESGPSIRFDSIYRSSSGFIARQAPNMKHHTDFGLTLILGENLRFEVWLPIRVFCLINIAEKEALSSSYKFFRQFTEIADQLEINNSNFLDLNQMFLELQAVANLFFKLLSASRSDTTAVNVKVKASGVRRKIPYLDVHQYIEQVKQVGVPISLFNQFTVPSGTSAGSFHEVPIYRTDGAYVSSYPVLGLSILNLTCTALGLNLNFGYESADTMRQLIEDLSEGHNRSDAAWLG